MRYKIYLAMVASLLLFCSRAALADTPGSGCVFGAGSTLICTLTEGPGESFASETPRAASGTFDLAPGFVVLFEPPIEQIGLNPLAIENWSDILWWVPTYPGSPVANVIAMFSDGSFIPSLDAGVICDFQTDQCASLGDIALSATFIEESAFPTVFNRLSEGGHFNDQYVVYSDVVPEPGTLTLFGTGLIGLASFLRRKFRA